MEANPRLTAHVMVGWLDPHCAICGRKAMEIQRNPHAPCQRHTLPFEFEKPAPAKAELKGTKERAS